MGTMQSVIPKRHEGTLYAGRGGFRLSPQVVRGRGEPVPEAFDLAPRNLAANLAIGRLIFVPNTVHVPAIVASAKTAAPASKPSTDLGPGSSRESGPSPSSSDGSPAGAVPKGSVQQAQERTAKRPGAR